MVSEASRSSLMVSISHLKSNRAAPKPPPYYPPTDRVGPRGLGRNLPPPPNEDIMPDVTDVTAVLQSGFSLERGELCEIMRALCVTLGAESHSWTEDHIERARRWALRQTHARRSVVDAIWHLRLYGIPTTPSPADNDDVIVDLSTNGPSSIIQLAACCRWTNERTRAVVQRLMDMGVVVEISPLLYALKPERTDA